MFALDEQSRMVEKMVRQWCETKLAPRIPALEAGVEPPYALMRDMAKTEVQLEAVVNRLKQLDDYKTYQELTRHKRNITLDLKAQDNALLSEQLPLFEGQ